MDETVLQERIGQLLSAVQHDREGADVLAPEAGSQAQGLPTGMRREMAALEDNLDHLRLAIKYLVFDLEATKRENRLLKGMLGEF